MTQNKIINIVIADDNLFFGAALKDSLHRDPFIEIKAVFTNLKDLILYTSTHKFDILILDINFNGENALDYISKIKPLNASFKIIALSSLNNNYIKEKAIEFGINTFVGKDSIFTGFPKIIKECFNNEKNNLKLLPSKFNIGDLKFTRKKIDVLQALYKYSEKNEKEMADKLHISESTFKFHKRELFEITNTKNSRELIKFGIRSGLILP